MVIFQRLKKRALSLSLGLVVLAVSKLAFAENWPLNVITALSKDDPLYQGLEHFQKTLAEKSAGKIPVRIFYGSQLGSDEDILEQARAGANVAVVIDGGRLSVYVPEFAILGAPFLVDNRFDARTLVLSPIFDEMALKLASQARLQVLSFNWWQGERHVLAQKAVHNPSDLSGIRMRTIGAPVFIETIKSLGATPTPLAWAEVYPALSQGVIDGAEAQHQATYSSKLFEVISDISKTGHIHLMTGIVVGDEWFRRLPVDLQSLVKEVAIEAGDLASDIAAARTQEFEQKMVAAGVNIHTIDKAPFREASVSVYQTLGLSSLREQMHAYLKEGESNRSVNTSDMGERNE